MVDLKKRRTPEQMGDDVLKKQRIRVCILILVILLAIFIFLAHGLYTSKNMLSESFHEIASPEVSEPVRIVQLTDLHNSEFGENNCELADRVAAQHPDLILITGDLLNQDTERTDIATGLIDGLKDIAPVYVSFGNHELGYEKKYGVDLRSLYTNAGAAVLEYDWLDLDVRGQKIRLGGLYGYCLSAKYKAEARKEECDFLEGFQNTRDVTILMCHMPVCWLINGSLDDWDVDIVFAGHSHGGQIILPGGSGVWAPDQGWFPGRVQGVFHSEDGKKTLVLSRGLGNRDKLPRFNNIPEIMVIDIVPVSD